MGNAYFLAASLPPLELKEKPGITFEEFKNRLELNLSPKDLELASVLRRLVDLYNIRSLFLEEAIDPRGNFDEKELDEALLTRDLLPEYVFDFLDRYETVADKVKYFFGLLTLFFQEEMAKHTGFVRWYLRFEREWRLVLMALRSKRSKRDLIAQLQFEDFSDSLVADILAQKDREDYTPPPEYAELKEFFVETGNDPWQQNLSLVEYRFRSIEEGVKAPLFSVEWVLSYLARLMLLEDWHELNKEKGRMILDTFKLS